MWLPQTYLSLNLTIPIHAVIFAKITPGRGKKCLQIATSIYCQVAFFISPKRMPVFKKMEIRCNANVSDFSREGQARWSCFV